MKAVARVASRVQIADIRLIGMNLKLIAESHEPQLTVNIERKCVGVLPNPKRIDVSCSYRFKGNDSQNEVVNIEMTYLLVYAVQDDEPVSDEYVKHFAFANGAYNSWPFARELFNSMTSRMGLSPFVLPVLTFAPPRPPVPAAASQPHQATAR